MKKLRKIFGLSALALSFLPNMAFAWLTYPQAEEAFQVEIQLPKGQSAIGVNKLAELTVTVRAPFATTAVTSKGLVVTQLAFDARMPEHNHGMLTKATVTPVSTPGNNTFKVKGVKLHMEGFWELIFVITTQQGKRHKVVVPFSLTAVSEK